MTDFAATYQQFLDMIEDEPVRVEVQEHLAKMAGSGAQSPEYAASHRDLVRVLKSRAPHALPNSWREDPTLEDVTKTYHHTDLRKDWKAVMEEAGVFSFGHLPTFEDIDKHYLNDRRGRKMPHATNQEPHGNDLGTRHKVVRLAALPQYRNNIEQLARDMDLPEDTPYRELVRTEHEAAATRVFDRAFRGEEQEEAAEGTGKAGENFKLSAGRSRGRTADEHQDPSVQTRDTAARVQDARDTATERTGEDQSAASIGDLLSKAGGSLDDTTQQILTAAKGYERFVRGDSVFNAWERDVKRQQKNIDAAEARFEASQKTDQDLMELAGANAEAHAQVGIYTAALEARLQAGPDLREALSDEQIDLIDRQAKRSVAIGSLARPMEYAVQKEYNMRDAGEHDRPYGPDEGEGEWSYYVVPLNELREAYNDLLRPLEPGEEAAPNRRQFQPTKPAERPAPSPAPAKEKPRRFPVEQPAEAPKPAAQPKAPAAPAAEEQPARDVKQAEREVRAELAERGIKALKEGGLKLAAQELAENPDQSAAQVLDALGDDVLKPRDRKQQTAPAVTLPEAEREATPVQPRQSNAERRAAERAERDARGGQRVKPSLPGFAPKPAASDAGGADDKGKASTLADALDMGAVGSTLAGRLESWRNTLSSKVKGDPKKVEAKWSALEQQLKGITDDDETARKVKVIDALEQFAKTNGLEREDSRFFGSLRFRVRPKTKTDPEGFSEPRKPQRSGGKGFQLKGESDWRNLGKSGRFPEAPRRFPVE